MKQTPERVNQRKKHAKKAEKTTLLLAFERAGIKKKDFEPDSHFTKNGIPPRLEKEPPE
jgi:hypothetical protein